MSVSGRNPTKAEIEACGKVHKQLAWLPDYFSQDDIISALRHLAYKLQMKLTAAEKKLKRK